MITINATGDTTIHTANKYCSEDILVKIPAGGSSGEKVVRGTIQMSEGTKSSGTVLATVSGLPFEPTAVYILACAGSGNSTSSSARTVCTSWATEINASSITAGGNSSSRVRLYSSNLYDAIEITEDGFVWKSKNSYAYCTSMYDYIAIGF